MKKIKIPSIKNEKDGLTKRGKYWNAFFYKDGTLSRKSLKVSKLSDAIAARDRLYAQLIEEGASQCSSLETSSPALWAAISNPEGDDCIYEYRRYQVVVKGHRIGTFDTADAARDARNKFIEENYNNEK